MHFIQKFIFSFIWVRNSFNTETNKNGMGGNVKIKPNFTDSLAVDKELLVHVSHHATIISLM